MGTLITSLKSKKLALIIALLLYSNLYCCVCSPILNIFNIYSKSELVADITVTKVRPSDDKSLVNKFYMVDVIYNTLYKGKKITSFYVSGTKLINNKYYGAMNSCSIGLEKGDRLIIFHNSENFELLNYCTPRISCNDKTKFYDSKKILENLSKQVADTNYKNFIIDTKFNSKTGSSDLDKFDGISAKNHFALLEIILNKDGSFKDATYITKFDSQFDQEILNYIKDSRILFKEKFQYSEGEKFILPIHLIKKDNNIKSVSFYY